MPGYTSLNPCPYTEEPVASFPSLPILSRRFHQKTKLHPYYPLFSKEIYA